MTIESNERAVEDLLNLVFDRLPQDRAEKIRSINRAGEPAVALEILLDNIIDLEIPVSREFRDAAVRVATAMKLPDTNDWARDLGELDPDRQQ